MFKRLSSYVVVAFVIAVLVSVIPPLKIWPTEAQGGCQTFPQTQKTVCGKFLTYWQTHGGLAQQGYPLTNQFTETSDLNGQAYAVQYFERAVFEAHPENAAPYDVLLSQLGTFQLQRKYPGGDPSGPPPVGATAPPLPPPPVAPTPTVASVPLGTYQAEATVSNPSPGQNSNVTVTGRLTRGGQGVAGAQMDTTWHYKTTVSGCNDVTNSLGVASCTRDISRATTGFTVIISVVFTAPDGTTVSTSTSFTPH